MTDDIAALFSENEKDLEKLIKTFDKPSKKDLNMNINVQKTKVLVWIVCGREKKTKVMIKIRRNQIVKQVN